MEELTNENAELKRQHFQLTQKISEIRNQIDALNNADDKDPTPTQINELLKQITTMLNEITSNQPPPSEGGLLSSLFSPGSSSSSSAAASPPSSPRSPPRIPLDTQIFFSPGQVFTLQEIIDQLNFKNNQMRRSDPNNKYARALSNIRIAASPEAIPGIIRNNSIYINNGRIIGGKRSRKTKKTKKIRRRQKGGYQYNEKSKRRRFTTSVPNSSTSRTSRTSSKTTSSLNKDKSKTRKTL